VERVVRHGTCPDRVDDPLPRPADPTAEPVLDVSGEVSGRDAVEEVVPTQ